MTYACFNFLGGFATLERLLPGFRVSFPFYNSEEKKNTVVAYSKFKHNAQACLTFKTRDKILTLSPLLHPFQPDMVGHYLGEFAMTYNPVKHGRAGAGATNASRFIPLK